MKYVGLCRNEDGSILFQKTPICKGVITENNIDLPAWSLHRLIEMKQPNKKDYMVAILSREQTYDKLIGMIAKSIKGGNFPKEYLEE